MRPNYFIESMFNWLRRTVNSFIEVLIEEAGAQGACQYKAMKPAHLIIASTCLTLLPTISHAVQPPRYLQVNGFEKCLAEQSKGTYSAWCMPSSKVNACPRASWKQLRALKGPDAVPRCSK